MPLTSVRLTNPTAFVPFLGTCFDPHCNSETSSFLWWSLGHDLKTLAHNSIGSDFITWLSLSSRVILLLLLWGLRFSIHTIYPRHLYRYFYILWCGRNIWCHIWSHTSVHGLWLLQVTFHFKKSFSGPFILAHFVCISVTFYRSLLRWVAHSLLFFIFSAYSQWSLQTDSEGDTISPINWPSRYLAFRMIGCVRDASINFHRF